MNLAPESTGGHVPFGPNRPRCKLVDRDGNVFVIIAAVKQALRDAGQHEAASDFVQQAFRCKSYDHVLALLVEFVDPY